MKLKYDIGAGRESSLKLSPDEKIWYAVPCDLYFDNKEKQAGSRFAHDYMLAVTNKRIVAFEGDEVAQSFDLKDCKKVKCEHQVHSGIVIVTTKDDEEFCIARFSMKDIVRVSYLARGAQTLIDALYESVIPGEADVVTSYEYEKYCPKCGRALPGTSKCPYCDGKADILKKFWFLCNEYIGRILVVSAIMVLIAGINLVSPMIQKDFIDGSLTTGKGTFTDLWIFIGLTLGLMVVRVGLNIYRSWSCTKLGASLSMSLRTKLYYKIQTLSLSFINNRKPGELMNRVSRDTRRIREFLEGVFGEMFSVLLTMVVSLVMMCVISVKMTLLSLAINLMAVVLTKAFWHTIHAIFHRQWVKQDELSNSLSDILAGMRVVKSFGKERTESDKFDRLNMEYAALSSRNESFWSIFFPVINFFLGAGTYIAIYFGGMDVLTGSMTVGELIQFLTYCGYFFGPLSWMTNLPRSIMQMITSLNRIYDVLDEEPELKNTEKSKRIEIKGDFEFNKISFGYRTYEPVLENVTFDVKAGEMIGLVGASGAGKSTLINLIMRLYDVDQGSIKIDGTDIKDIEIECLHSQIGVVLQETFLFSGSILANIRFAKPDATLEEVIRAAKAANAHDFICKTPDGYNTYVGEHGYNLSGGERQRISIARAILNDPKLLILDEATSALDTESEFLIQQALSRLTKGRTTFAIAHRLSTLREANRLVVIDKHGVAEIGTHNELLEQKGIYYGLVTAQLQMAEGK